MAEAKTKASQLSVRAFLDKAAEGERRAECAKLVKLMSAATGAKPVIWGTNIVGFGRYRYVYASGREGEWPIVGFSPRKRDLTVYIMPGFERFGPLLKRLGPHKTGKSCLYLKGLTGLDEAALKELIEQSVAAMASKRVDR
jgi:hypothetical protein